MTSASPTPSWPAGLPGELDGKQDVPLLPGQVASQEGSVGQQHLGARRPDRADRLAVLRRMVSWLAPGGWLLLEECDFGMWLGDFDPM